MTQRKNFEKLTEWINSFKDARGEQPLLMIGNKSDLKDLLKVDEKEAEEFAKKHKMEFIFTSAKTGENVEKSFTVLATKILEKISKEI